VFLAFCLGILVGAEVGIARRHAELDQVRRDWADESQRWRRLLDVTGLVPPGGQEFQICRAYADGGQDCCGAVYVDGGAHALCEPPDR
jgi:hypothetical protein